MINKAENILDNLLIKTYQNVYYIGTEQRGITIYKQQVRALNLIYSLQKLNKIKPGSKIGIIGGGIGGITASAAALSIGCNVYLYENKPILLHLQTGCKTRWVHPNIYEWPSPGSDFPYAGLPLLNWKEGYSSDVAQDFMIEYSKITKSYASKYKELLGVNFKSVDLGKRKINHDFSLNPNFVKFDATFDVIILATGFGLETGISNNDQSIAKSVNSYWRNDDLDQPFIGESKSAKRNVIISGTGDGACIDLLRSTLKNFHQGRLIVDIFSECDGPDTIKNLINSIKEKAIREENSPGWLYEAFSSLPDNLLEGLKHYIGDQCRKDTNVTLIGRYNDISEIFSTKKMSIFNAFAVYLMYSVGGFTYHGTSDEELNIKNKKSSNRYVVLNLLVPYNGQGQIHLPFDTIILRHGPEKGIKHSLESLGVSDLSFADYNDTGGRIWEPGWPLNLSEKTFGVEFVPPLLKAIATTFIEILGETLLYFHKDKNPSFRLTLDRFIEINNEVYFQQVCRYAGTVKFGNDIKMGRIFPAEHGIVGYCASTSEAVLLKREHDFSEAVSFLKLELLFADPIREELKEMLGIPLFVSDKNGEIFVNSVLYLDSSEEGFFSENVIEVILNSCHGFIKNLEKMFEHNEIRVVENYFKGLKPNKNVPFETNFKSLRTGKQISPNIHNNKLMFQRVQSFDIYE